MKKSIEAIESKLLKKAQELYNEGKFAEAAEEAQKIPQGGSSYQPAQALIATIVVPDIAVPDYSWLSERPIAEADLKGKSALNLDIMRNYFYAKWGLKFRRPDLQEAFKAQPWYQPTDISSEDCAKQFSDLEKKNLDVIIRFLEEEKALLNLGMNSLIPSPSP